MTEFQHDNPYASPLGAEEPADMTEGVGVWRDGDELVMLTARVKPPKACWVTTGRGWFFRVRSCAIRRRWRFRCC